jgi:methylenetetrahydrofolate reductase (NADPH)
MQNQRTFDRTFSFEFFPPKTPEGVAKLRATREQLAQLKPKFFSVTFGAGGSTRDRTLETVVEIQSSGNEAAPHLSCIGSTRENITAILEQYKANGIRHIVALRGDLPSGTVDAGEFRYANELVAFIRQQTGDWFHIEVAAYPETHPQARSPKDDLDNFKRKVDAGANSAITQYFFNNDAYFDFVDRCEAAGVKIPIVPGIMPVSNFAAITRMSQLTGTAIPSWMADVFNGLDDHPSARQLVAATVSAEMCRKLYAGGVREFHFYTLNRAELSYAICHLLGKRPAAVAQKAAA